jgi:hypothetical protein
VGVSEDDEPLVPDLINTDPVFIDSDDSGDSPSLSRIELRHGFTTTKTGWSSTTAECGS